MNSQTLNHVIVDAVRYIEDRFDVVEYHHHSIRKLVFIYRDDELTYSEPVFWCTTCVHVQVMVYFNF